MIIKPMCRVHTIRLLAVPAVGIEKCAIKSWHRHKRQVIKKQLSGQMFSLCTCIPSFPYNCCTMPDDFIPKHPVIAAYPKVPQAFTEAEAMSKYLKEKGIEAPFGSLYDESLAQACPPRRV